MKIDIELTPAISELIMIHVKLGRVESIKYVQEKTLVDLPTRYIIRPPVAYKIEYGDDGNEVMIMLHASNAGIMSYTVYKVNRVEYRNTPPVEDKQVIAPVSTSTPVPASTPASTSTPAPVSTPTPTSTPAPPPIQEKFIKSCKTDLTFVTANFSSVTPYNLNAGFRTAAFYNNLEIFKFLLQNAPIDVNSSNVFGETALSHAVKQGNIEIIRVALQDLRFNLVYPIDILDLAVTKNQESIVKLLLDTDRQGCQVPADVAGLTAIWAAYRCQTNMLQIILASDRFDGSIQARDVGYPQGSDGDFITASQLHNSDTLKMFLSHPKVPVRPDCSMALKYAALFNNLESVKLLFADRRVDTKINIKSVLDAAVSELSLDVLKYLLDQPSVKQAISRDEFVEYHRPLYLQ